jgi:hypothetical protein
MTKATQIKTKTTEPPVSISRLIRRPAVWPISNLCKGGPAAPAFGGYGLDRACCPAIVSRQCIDGDIRLMR